MDPYAGHQARFDDRQLRERGILDPPWRPTEFRKFNPHEPRVPGGEHGGEWSKAGALVKKAAEVLNPNAAVATTHTDRMSIRQSLRDAPDIRSINAVVRSEARALGGRGDLYVSFQGHDLRTAREHAEGVLRGIERLPRVRVGVDHAHHPAGVYGQYAETRGWVIKFNTAFARPAGREEYLSALKTDVERDWHPHGTDHPSAVALHEFGHAVDFFFTSMESTPNGAGLVPVARLREAAGALAHQMARTAGMDTDDYIGEQLGGYAAKDLAELFAEAFSDAMVNGDSASDLSKAIFGLVTDYYARLEKVSPR